MEENKINSSGNIGRTLILVIALVVIGVSGSYAYYTKVAQVKSTTTTATSGKIDISSNLEVTDNAIKILDEDLRLINAGDIETKAKSLEFNIDSTKSTVNAKYEIYIKGITLTKNLYNADFKWQLVKKGTSNTVIAQGNFSTAVRKEPAEVAGEVYNVSTKANDINLMNYLAEGITANDVVIAAGTTENFIFRIWLENNTSRNQIDLTNGSFEGKLGIAAYPAPVVTP